MLLRYDALMAYMFVSVYRGVAKDVAIVRESESDDNVIIFNKMGFKDISEYVGSYPGKFHIDSDLLIKYMTNVDNSIDYMLCSHYGKVSINMSEECIDVKTINNCYCNSESFPTPFIVPTVSEVARCENISDVDYEKLWFCSDWNGE